MQIGTTNRATGHSRLWDNRSTMPLHLKWRYNNNNTDLFCQKNGVQLVPGRANDQIRDKVLICTGKSSWSSNAEIGAIAATLETQKKKGKRSRQHSKP